MDDEEAWDPDGLAYALEVARGMESEQLSKRKASEKIWTAIANGKACDGTVLVWARYVANKIIKEILQNKKLVEDQRGSAALRCIEIWQRDDEYRELRDYINTRLWFETLVEPSDRVRRKLGPMDIVKDWRGRGYFKGICDRAAAKRVKRQWDKAVNKDNEG